MVSSTLGAFSGIEQRERLLEILEWQSWPFRLPGSRPLRSLFTLPSHRKQNRQDIEYRYRFWDSIYPAKMIVA